MAHLWLRWMLFEYGFLCHDSKISGTKNVSWALISIQSHRTFFSIWHVKALWLEISLSFHIDAIVQTILIPCFSWLKLVSQTFSFYAEHTHKKLEPYWSQLKFRKLKLKNLKRQYILGPRVRSERKSRVCSH